MRSRICASTLILMGVITYIVLPGCFLSEEKKVFLPVTVNCSGQIKSGHSNLPLPDQEVFLVLTSSGGSAIHTYHVYEDTIQTTKTDANGNFFFTYTDPNLRDNWFTIHASHSDYIDKIVGTRNHPALEQYHEDILLKPKSWLNIRVLDIPEQNETKSGITFFNLNSDQNYLWYAHNDGLSIRPSQGDTTFFAFKPGGELTSFGYYNSDSMGWVSYEDIFPPFDTTHLLFTY